MHMLLLLCCTHLWMRYLTRTHDMMMSIGLGLWFAIYAVCTLFFFFFFLNFCIAYGVLFLFFTCFIWFCLLLRGERFIYLMVHFYTCTLVCIIESWMRLGDKPLVSIKKLIGLSLELRYGLTCQKQRSNPLMLDVRAMLLFRSRYSQVYARKPRTASSPLISTQSPIVVSIQWLLFVDQSRGTSVRNNPEFRRPLPH